MKIRHNLSGVLASLALGLALVALPVTLPAQISLTTAITLAQRNSSAVKLSEADVAKALAALHQAQDVYIPNLSVNAGLPAFPAVGFTGGVPSMLSGAVQSEVISFPQRQYIHAARDGLRAANQQLKDAHEQVALDAAVAYIELDTIIREQAAAGEQAAFAERLVSIEQERAEAGVDPLSALLEARLTSAQLRLKSLHLETRADTLAEQLATLTGLPKISIVPDHASIPEIPTVHADEPHQTTAGIRSAQLLASAKRKLARGDQMSLILPEIVFSGLYVRNTTILNDANRYYAKPLPTNNFSSGFSIQVPLLDFRRRDKAKESAADSLRATVEAEQAQRQNDVQIATLTGSLRELDAQAEIASLQQQISAEQLKAIQAQLELGNGTGSGPGSTPQLSPKAEQLARIDERQKFVDSLDASVDLSKTRLSLLRALGHMDDWLHTLLPVAGANK